MGLKIVRRVRDNVHGSIDISDVEDLVLAHPYFQRLRRVKQLAFLNYVFPGASHSRFEHSLGVMHMAGVAWEKLKVNQERLAHSLQAFDRYEEREKREDAEAMHGQLAPSFPLANRIFASGYILQALRLAALLHDVGHPPFSHSGERFLPSWAEFIAQNADAPTYLLTYFKDVTADFAAKGRPLAETCVRHEIYSMTMVAKVFADIGAKMPECGGVRLEAQDVIAIINPHVPPAPGSPLASLGALGLSHELISGELDIDRMDYLLRDSRECGVVYGIFDAGRILDSLNVYYDAASGGLHIAIGLSGLAAFEDYLRARYSMYLQLYFHKTAVSSEAMLQHCAGQLGDWRFPCRIERYAQVDEYNVGDILLRHAQKTLSPAAFTGFSRTLRDLLYNRALWKRVYEVSGRGEDPNASRGIVAVKNLLAGMGVPYEQISSRNSLTRFQPRDGDSPSANTLRLIKKDESQFPRVVPIEDFSELIHQNKSISIHRIYVPQGVAADGEDLPTLVKRKILEALASS